MYHIMYHVCITSIVTCKMIFLKKYYFLKKICEKNSSVYYMYTCNHIGTSVPSIPDLFCFSLSTLSHLFFLVHFFPAFLFPVPTLNTYHNNFNISPVLGSLLNFSHRKNLQFIWFWATNGTAVDITF